MRAAFRTSSLFYLGLMTLFSKKLCGSPSLVVMGGDSCPEGVGFESQHRILDGHFSHKFVVKIAIFV